MGMDDAGELEKQARKQELWREQKQRQRERKRKSGLVPNSPRPAPGQVRQKLGELARSVEPLGAVEAKRQIKHATLGAAKLMGSQVDPDDPDLEDALTDAGEAYADASKVLWPLRLFIRVLIPLVIVGAFWRIGAKLVTTTPWWQRRQEKKREKEERQSGGLRVLEAPSGEVPPAGQQPPPYIPRPGIKLPRKSPFN